MEGAVLHRNPGSRCEPGSGTCPYCQPVRVCIQCGRLLPRGPRRGRPRTSCGSLACENALKRERRRAAYVRARVQRGLYAPAGHCERCGYRSIRCRCAESNRQQGDGG